MTKGNPNKEINKVIRERLANGENKADIFKYLQTQFDGANLSARLLSLWPYPEQCQKYRILNRVLVGVLVATTVIKILSAGFFILSEIPKAIAIPLLLFVPLINIYLIYLVARFNGLGYMLTVLLGLAGLCKMTEELIDAPFLVNIISTSVVSLLILVAMVFAMVLHRRLLPNTTFFMQPRKDKAGEYIF